MSHLPISAWGIVLKLFVISASSCSVMLSTQQQHLNLCTWSHKSRPRESAFKAVIGKGESLLVNIAFYEVLPSGHPGCNWNPIGFLNKWNLTHPFFFVLPLDFLNFLAILINSEFTKRSWVQRQQVQGLLIQKLSSSSGKVSSPFLIPRHFGMSGVVTELMCFLAWMLSSEAVSLSWSPTLHTPQPQAPSTLSSWYLHVFSPQDRKRASKLETTLKHLMRTERACLGSSTTHGKWLWQLR